MSRDNPCCRHGNRVRRNAGNLENWWQNRRVNARFTTDGGRRSTGSFKGSDDRLSRLFRTRAGGPSVLPGSPEQERERHGLEMVYAGIQQGLEFMPPGSLWSRSLQPLAVTLEEVLAGDQPASHPRPAEPPR